MKNRNLHLQKFKISLVTLSQKCSKYLNELFILVALKISRAHLNT